MTNPGRVEVSIDEATAAMNTPKGTDATVKLEGDHIPEQFRGKTLDDVIKMNTAAMESLKISEEARKAAEARGNTPQVTREIIREETKPVVEPDLTDEQLAEAFEKNPVLAVRYMTEKAKKDAERNIEARLGPLAASAMSNGESYAKTKYADEFSVLGKEIDEIKAEIIKNGGQASLSTPQGWDQVISYIRGKPGNFEKVIESRTKAAGEKAAREAREAQSRGTGYSPSPAAGGGTAVAADNTRAISDASGLDETERRIADKFIDMGTFKDYAEYVKWQKLGG